MGFGKNLQEKIIDSLNESDLDFFDVYSSGRKILVLLNSNEKNVYNKYEYRGSGVFFYRGQVEVIGGV